MRWRVAVLLLLWPAVSEPASAAAPYEATDPDGDVTVEFAGGPTPLPAPDADLGPFVDLIRISLTDLSVAELQVTLENKAGFQARTTPETQLVSGNDRIYHEIIFEVPGS